MTKHSALAHVSGRGKLPSLLSLVTSGTPHLFHHLPRRAFSIPGELRNASGGCAGVLSHLFAIRENTARLPVAFPHKAPRLFSTQEKNGQTGSDSDPYSNE